MAELVYRPIIAAAKTTFAGLGLRFDIVGLENMPRTGGAVLAMNHTSYLDFAYIAFTVGATFQVSDNSVGSTRLRNLVTAHGLSAYVYNTAGDAGFSGRLQGLVDNMSAGRPFDPAALAKPAAK